ncbi:MAG: D-alanyl-D-alanine carboxypeptidase [Proteobacteria bacterium]|nr:D-alanyl-D-alanine carboxypeptidase [Pseudomonadota bacterium]
MHYFVSRFCLLLMLLSMLPAQAQPVLQPPAMAARSWLLLDFSSGQQLAGINSVERVEPASLTKLMTAYLSFAALRQGSLKLEQVVPVSERAWKAQGSRMFIEPKHPVKVEELLRGMIVQSGNDACIALAEAIAGSEEAFVQLMNREAQRLGLLHTQFRNSTGLPDPQHYSTAHDLAFLAAALIRDFPDDYPLYSLKTYSYNSITQHNRNRLLWLDAQVDGVKTGHTEGAGYCLIASAKRGARRLLAVVLGAASDASRAQDALKLLNYGFQSYDGVKLYELNQTVSQLRVFKGEQNSVRAGFSSEFALSVPKGQAASIKVQLAAQPPLQAPIAMGQRIATLQLFLGTTPWGEYPLVALEAVPAAGIFGRARDTVRLWFE